ncbi:hypothetical protein QE382_004342 [Sphingobacterium zeae]|uniref:Uncharacterized protein n=1 Tax=Sphingobacterium zeae TaxID=1776859 RepID=A0ABU0UBX9_9SPHI|nr:hypothetical protein [Sphingobacterium zeae]MDQ1152358.1 hypothetical protein [Sphingobacterium zeae]
MKKDEKKLVGTLAHFMVSDLDRAEFTAFLHSMRDSLPTIRTDLAQFAANWQDREEFFFLRNEDLWNDFEQLSRRNPDLGVALIDGNKIDSIASFYEEINAVYMSSESWKIGSLDGFDDLLYGGFGIFKDATSHAIVWKDIDHSSASLGIETTLAYYQGKLGARSPFNQTHFQKKIEELKAGQGETYFDIVAEIIRSHHKITWIYKGHPHHQSVYL